MERVERHKTVELTSGARQADDGVNAQLTVNVDETTERLFTIAHVVDPDHPARHTSQSRDRFDSHCHERVRQTTTCIISPPGIAMPPAGSCFTAVSFLKRPPSHSTTGGRIARQRCYDGRP